MYLLVKGDICNVVGVIDGWVKFKWVWFIMIDGCNNNEWYVINIFWIVIYKIRVFVKKIVLSFILFSSLKYKFNL